MRVYFALNNISSTVCLQTLVTILPQDARNNMQNKHDAALP